MISRIDAVLTYINEQMPRCYTDTGGHARRTAFQEIKDLICAPATVVEPIDWESVAEARADTLKDLAARYNLARSAIINAIDTLANPGRFGSPDDALASLQSARAALFGHGTPDATVVEDGEDARTSALKAVLADNQKFGPWMSDALVKQVLAALAPTTPVGSEDHGLASADLSQGGPNSHPVTEARAKLESDDLKRLVSRFLSWKLPENFSPDCGITFKAEHSEEFMASRGKPPMKHEPVGTNLLDARQAEAMLRHVLAEFIG